MYGGHARGGVLSKLLYLVHLLLEVENEELMFM